MTKSKEEWKKILSEKEYDVLRNEGTERAYTSALNDEKREGNYYCIGCNNKLFSSKMKFDSGTGWPSFFESYPGAFETSTDYKLIYPRTEYHCAKFKSILRNFFKIYSPNMINKSFFTNFRCKIRIIHINYFFLE